MNMHEFPNEISLLAHRITISYLSPLSSVFPGAHLLPPGPRDTLAGTSKLIKCCPLQGSHSSPSKPQGHPSKQPTFVLKVLVSQQVELSLLS